MLKPTRFSLKELEVQNVFCEVSVLVLFKFQNSPSVPDFQDLG